MQKYQKKSQKGQVRIIGGKWRGHKLAVLTSVGLRPTTDRIKETLFNWLMNHVADANCLDCFAGSGNLGFEALSRGAASLICLEKNHQAVQQIEQNAKLLPSAQINILETETLMYLRHAQPIAMDIIFIDPPYADGLVLPTIHLLEERGWLAPQSWIYIETERRLEALEMPNNWQLHHKKFTKKISYSLYYRTKA